MFPSKTYPRRASETHDEENTQSNLCGVKARILGRAKLRQRSVLEDTLRTKRAWIKLKFDFDLKDHPGQNQILQKDCWQRWLCLSRGWVTLAKLGAHLRPKHVSQMEAVSPAQHVLLGFTVISGVGVCRYYWSGSPLPLSSQQHYWKEMSGGCFSKVRWSLWHQLELKLALRNDWRKTSQLPSPLPASQLST